MVYRLLALNIDGTLLKGNAKMTRETKKAIDYVQKKGVYVTLVTSRPFPSAKKIAKSLKLDGYIITSGGAYICKQDGHILLNRMIEDEKALQIIQIAEQFNCFIRVMDENFAIGNKVKQKNTAIDKMTISGGDLPFYPTMYVDSVSEYMYQKGVEPQKMIIQFFDSNDRKQAMKQLGQITGIHCTESPVNQIEIIRTGVSKLNGLRLLGRKLAIQAEQMVAVGSSESDFEMIHHVGLGVAMGNSSVKLQEAADWLTRTNDQNGVAYMVREVFRKQLRVQI